MSEYYRVVDDCPRDGRPQEESTLRRWKRREFRSTNEGPPPQWVDAWQEGKRKGKFFPRSIPNLGWSSKDAKRLFLYYAKRYGLESQEMVIAKYRLGEQDGVHCCETPNHIWKYMAGIVEGNYVVQFNGEKLASESIAEDYGVQVRNVEPVGDPIPAETFGALHNLTPPEPPGEFIDSVDEYE